ncbi:hypothetical protein TCAL_05684, partial [Tigriopus californicus]
MTYPLYAACRLVFGTLYPAYASYKAVRTKNVREYVKWMMYWIVFAFFTTFESMADLFIAFWFPFYYELKIIFLLWLISPVSRGSLGSSMLYRKLIHPNLMKREDEIDRMIGKLQEQGYNTAIRFGSQAFQYVTNLVMTTAIRAPEILAELANAQRPSDQVDGVGNYRPRRIPLQQQNLLGSSPVLEVLDRSDDISMDGLDTFQANELSRQTDVIMDEMNGPASQSSKPGTQRAINFGYSEEEEDDDNQPGALVVTRVPKAKTANLARVPLDFSSGSEDESKPFPSTSNQSVSLPRRGRVAKTKANKALSERSDATLAVEPQKKTKGGGGIVSQLKKSYSLTDLSNMDEADYDQHGKSRDPANRSYPRAIGYHGQPEDDPYFSRERSESRGSGSRSRDNPYEPMFYSESPMRHHTRRDDETQGTLKKKDELDGERTPIGGDRMADLAQIQDLERVALRLRETMEQAPPPVPMKFSHSSASPSTRREPFIEERPLPSVAMGRETRSRTGSISSQSGSNTSSRPQSRGERIQRKQRAPQPPSGDPGWVIHPRPPPLSYPQPAASNYDAEQEKLIRPVAPKMTYPDQTRPKLRDVELQGPITSPSTELYPETTRRKSGAPHVKESLLVKPTSNIRPKTLAMSSSMSQSRLASRLAYPEDTEDLPRAKSMAILPSSNPNLTRRTTSNRNIAHSAKRDSVTLDELDE